MGTFKAYQQRFLWGFGVVALAISLIGFGWLRGHRFAPFVTNGHEAGPAAESFRVAGCSMVPTLYGPTLRVNCSNCRREVLFDAQSLSRGGGDLICSLCGMRHEMSDRNFAQSLTTYLGDVVQVNEVSANEYRVGDLVAIDREGKTQVKRIAALGGDEVDVDPLHLLVNGQRLEDRIASDAQVSPAPPLTVDDDSLRAMSRWSAADDGGRWIRDTNGRWLAESESTWLIYHHRNVHDHNRPSGVMDDYQYNAGIARQLAGVDRLLISGTLTSDQGATVLVAFWSAQANVRAKQWLDRGAAFQISFADGVPANHLPVTRERPLAIRIVGEGATIEFLTVKRDVQYRLNPKHDRSVYPLRIPAGHCFVVGDNVPFSVDSRSWGPLALGRVLGRVEVVATASSRE